MATVFSVAKYILDNYGAMSAMKLQKLVFYSQAMSMVWDDVPLFDDDFEAWAKGPVCRALFNAHKGRFMLFDSHFLDEYGADVDELSTDNIETIDAVVESLIELTPLQLSNMTHSEDPWKDARGGLPANASCDAIISKNAMETYYSENW